MPSRTSCRWGSQTMRAHPARSPTISVNTTAFRATIPIWAIVAFLEGGFDPVIPTHDPSLCHLAYHNLNSSLVDRFLVRGYINLAQRYCVAASGALPGPRCNLGMHLHGDSQSSNPASDAPNPYSLTKSTSLKLHFWSFGKFITKRMYAAYAA